MAETLFKIGDVANMLATSIRAIRYYEEEGLLSPLRSQGGTRFYSPRHVDRLRAILRLTKCGYSIELIKALARTREQNRTGDDSQKAVSIRLDEMFADVVTQIQQLRELGAQIAAAKKTVQKCSGCKNEPSSEGCPQCPVQQCLADIELLNLIWD